MLRPRSDGSAASWIARSLHPFWSGDVGALVPPVFDAFARILHPAWADDGSPVRWATVAAWSGGSAHARAQFEPMARERGRSSDPRPFRDPPRSGELTPATLAALCDVFARHTATPDRCCFGLWEGYGWITPAQRRSARLALPERGYFLVEGTLAGVAEIGWRWDELVDQASLRVDRALVPLSSGPEPRKSPWERVKAWTKLRANPTRATTAPTVAAIEHATGVIFHQESPNLIWPSDRRWFVASEIDLDSTFVGGSAELIGELLGDPRLEAWPAHPTDPVTAGTDHINGDT